jgi:hypothetical protein
LAACLLSALLTAQEEQPQLLRYALKAGSKQHFLYEQSWSTADRQASSSLQMWTELAIVNVKGEVAEATMTFVRITAQTRLPQGEAGYDSGAGHGMGRLGQTMYPAELHDLLKKPFKLSLDTRGRFGNVKPPEKAKDKDVQALLGGVSTEAFFGLCLVPLPEGPVRVGEQWTTPLELRLAQAGTCTFEATNTLSSREGTKAVLAQQFATKGTTAMRFLADKSKGTAELEPGGGIPARGLELSFQGPMEFAGIAGSGDLVVKVSRTEAPPKGSRRK